MQSVLLFVGQ